jgi:hypothetical protein
MVCLIVHSGNSTAQSVTRDVLSSYFHEMLYIQVATGIGLCLEIGVGTIMSAFMSLCRFPIVVVVPFFASALRLMTDGQIEIISHDSQVRYFLWNIMRQRNWCPPFFLLPVVSYLVT